MRIRKKSYIIVFLANLFKIVLRIVLFPVVIGWFFVGLHKKHKNKDKIMLFNMTQIDSLSGVEFENFLRDVFEKQGYKVETTKASHDYGADLLLSKNGKLSIVQAKCYAKTVGIKAIQEIVGAKQHYGATEAFVATNNFFSKDAEILALENDVKLIDRAVLEKFVSKYDFHIKKMGSNFSAISQTSKNEINQRFQHMI